MAAGFRKTAAGRAAAGDASSIARRKSGRLSACTAAAERTGWHKAQRKICRMHLTYQADFYEFYERWPIGSAGAIKAGRLIVQLLEAFSLISPGPSPA